MKKIVFIFITLLGLSVGYAQSLYDTPYLRTGVPANWQQNLETIFYQNIPQQKPWQVAMFLGAESRPVEEVLQTITAEMEKGFITDAAILYFKEKNIPTLYTVTSYDKTAQINSKTLDENLSISDLLDALLDELPTYDKKYTAFIINGHSNDGVLLKYANKKLFRISDLLKGIQERRLYIDVLDLEICLMGNLYITYELARYQNIHYVILSSQIRRSRNDRMHYYILEQLENIPLDAALETSNEIAANVAYTNTEHSHNLIVMDVTKLRQPLKYWGKGIHDTSLIPVPKTSIYSILDKSTIKGSKELRTALDDAIIYQWCYSAKDRTIYESFIPTDSDCIDGLFVDRYTFTQFQELLVNPSLW